MRRQEQFLAILSVLCDLCQVHMSSFLVMSMSRFSYNATNQRENAPASGAGIVLKAMRNPRHEKGTVILGIVVLGEHARVGDLLSGAALPRAC